MNRPCGSSHVFGPTKENSYRAVCSKPVNHDGTHACALDVGEPGQCLVMEWDDDGDSVGFSRRPK